MSNKEKAIVVIIVLALALAIIALLAPAPASGGTFTSPILDKHSYLPLLQCDASCPTARPAPTPSETLKISPTPTKLAQLPTR